MINYEKLITTCKAGADLTDAEGCFVYNNNNAVNLASVATEAQNIFGLLHGKAAAGEDVSVILPGFSGVPAVKLHSSASNVTPGTKLFVDDGGAVKPASSGVVVAVALAPGTGGDMIAARLVEPYTV